MKLNKSYLGTFSALILAGASVTAQAAFLPFTIEEGSVPGANPNERTANKFTGLYSERITIEADGTVNFVGFVEFQGIGVDDGDGGTIGVQNQIGCYGDNCYNLYAIFEGSGQFDGGSGFSIDTASLALFIDPEQDTGRTFGTTGADPVTLTGNDEDYQIAVANNVTMGVGIAGVPGAFQAMWDDFSLTTDGEDYFIAPRPFHLIVETTGDFDRDTFEVGTFTVSGDISASFAPIPEPSTLALMGLSLVALGAAVQRRRQNS